MKRVHNTQISPEEKQEFLRFVGARIRNAREAEGLLQRECAEQVGAARSWWTDMEKGKFVVDLFMLHLIARLFRRPVAWFIDRRYPLDDPVDRDAIDWDSVFPRDPTRASVHREFDAQITANLNEATQKARLALARAAANRPLED